MKPKNAAVAPTKESPKTVKLTRAQQISLQALAQSEQIINQQIEQTNQKMNQLVAALQDARDSRKEILAEVAEVSGVASFDSYQFNGKELILTTKP